MAFGGYHGLSLRTQAAVVDISCFKPTGIIMSFHSQHDKGHNSQLSLKYTEREMDNQEAYVISV